ncbi:MAG: ABC transporter permease subunit, partial [Lachnospiraceae bacterium]|nr:ABC transporter permease subunit [Lachnospiraceae bacterium]
MRLDNQNGRFRLRLKTYWPYYLMVLPGVVYLFVFKFIPMFGSIIAFQDFSVAKGILGSKFVGLKHFRKLFTHPDFYKILRNSLVLSGLKIVFTVPVPIILALMLDEIRVGSLKKTIQTIICIPHFVSWAVVGGLVFGFLGIGGLFNNVRAMLDMDPLLVMQKERWFRTIYVITSIWKDAGWQTIVYLAAIAGISPELYESAMMDGASRFQRMKNITLPSMYSWHIPSPRKSLPFYPASHQTDGHYKFRP